MNKLLLAMLTFGAALSAQAQTAVPDAVNPFVATATAPPLPEPLPLPDGKGAPGHRSAPTPTPLPGYTQGQADLAMPQELKTALDGMVLIGRTKTHAILGFPLMASSQAASGQSKALRNVTVKNGGTFYIGAKKVKLEMDDDQPGVRVVMNGAVIAAADVESQQSVAPPQTQTEQAASGGFGIGQSSTSGSGASGSAMRSTGTGAAGQANQPTNGFPPVQR